ncbi:hypothetical protein RM549_15050 [Salegentibacter sp. F188]|uniref:Peptidase M56 domain-containing protein n=1 Tax=Autumnicola patrickiae TaxID=3075591 RepID=A0ABU3E5A0_9FLAO|nr:hypothetical protein [Salegentibacter sp. F188]MDT0691110.1 hypothetical protein [Salegentibacter sp. F188]
MNKYLLGKGFKGITLWPFIILKYPWLKDDRLLINHERIHLRQQLELLVVFFYIWYFIEFLIRLLRHKDSHKAYLNISFEREAYKMESDGQYLNRRSFWAFLNYL